MAKKVRTVTVDDLDGSSEAALVRFALDGLDYEINLGPGNRQRLYEELLPFTEAGRQIGQPRPDRSLASRDDWAEIRAWALAQGLQVSAHGRICASVVRRYEVAKGVTSNGQPKQASRTLERHVIGPGCPLPCIEQQLPGRAYKALFQYLKEEECFVHPQVSDVVELYHQRGHAQGPDR